MMRLFKFSKASVSRGTPNGGGEPDESRTDEDHCGFVADSCGGNRHTLDGNGSRRILTRLSSRNTARGRDRSGRNGGQHCKHNDDDLPTHDPVTSVVL
jgi:hypothetical protein